MTNGSQYGQVFSVLLRGTMDHDLTFTQLVGDSPSEFGTRPQNKPERIGAPWDCAQRPGNS